MKKLDFENPKDRDQALANFKGLLNHPGWKLVEYIVNANIELIKDQLLQGVEGETKEAIDRLRDKLKCYQDIINTPNNWIKILEPQDLPEEINDDPFTNIELEQKKS